MTFTRRANCSLVAGLLASAALLAPAVASAQEAGAERDGDILVTAQRANQTQVSGGGDLGVFGKKAAEDIPFNVRAYNEALILNQQPDSLGEVLENDPTIRTTLGFGIAGEVFVIRGFELASDDVGFDGLYGITPRQLISPELFSSVQVINGASAFINGAAPGGSGIGGSVNLLAKKAERDLTRVTVGYTSGSQFGGAIDVARRFGADREWGLRINGAIRSGDIAVNDEFHSSYVLGGTLDYNSGAFRAALNVNYQKLKQTNWRPKVAIGTVIPTVPAADANYSQPWSLIETRDVFGSLSLEYDVAENATLYFKAGARDGREDQVTAGLEVTNALTGAAIGKGSYVPRTDNNESLTAGLRVKLVGGGISHEINFGGAVSWQVNRNAFDFLDNYATNLYNPPIVARPPSTVASWNPGGNLANPFPISRTRVASAFASDTIGLWDDRILITGGLRLQQIRTRSYLYGTGALDIDYKKDAVTPVVGVVVKPAQGLSLYANRIEGLTPGTVPPGTTFIGATPYTVINAGTAVQAAKSVQYEVGSKVSLGKFNAGLALFQIDRPSAFYRVVSPTQVELGNFALQRNRGIEFTVDGEPVEGLRVIAGLTVNDAKLRRANDPLIVGNKAPGVPDVLANANVEWDLPFAPALTLTGRVVYTGKQAVNRENTLFLGSWTRFDLGARYVALVADKPLTLRFNVDNVGNKRYWASAFSLSGTELLQGGPRTFKVSASVDF